MTENNNDLEDLDIQDELDQGPVEKPSLKDVWQTNPMLKIAAVVVVGAVLVGGYMTLTKKNPVEEAKTIMRGPETSAVKAIPGKGELDKTYVDALKQKNEQAAKKAAATGGSVIPVPITSAKTQGLPIPQMGSTQSEADPLQEWKKTVAARRLKTDDAAADEDIVAPQPDLVPMVQPVRPQPVVKMDPQAASKMAHQMRTLIAAQAPHKSAGVSITGIPSLFSRKIAADKKMEKEASAGKSGGSGGDFGDDGGGGSAKAKVIVPAGQIAYAQLLTELNSDIPGPALAVVMSGPFAGGRALGDMSKRDEYIVINFKRIVKDGVSYSIDGVALDENTTLPATRTDINHHYLSRIMLPAAAKFLEAYTGSVAETGTETTTTAGGGVATNQPEPSQKESLYKGFESASGTVADVIQENVPKGPTIKIARGTTMGILFMSPVKTSNAEK